MLLDLNFRSSTLLVLLAYLSRSFDVDAYENMYFTALPGLYPLISAIL